MPAPAAPRCLALALFALAVWTGCDTTIQIGDPRAEKPLAQAVEHAGDWSWVPVEEATCRDGSGTGFGARLRETASSLLIYLEGGGACFNDPTCSQNRDSFGARAFDVAVTGARGTKGIFDPSRPANPVARWHAAYVPYCTGDVHAGTARDVRVDGLEAPQQFVGHANFERYLDVLAGHFGSNIERVLLAGSSAGGYGALINYQATRAAFPGARVTLLDDSGPPVFSDAVLAPALELRWMNLWDVAGALPDEAHVLVRQEGLAAIYAHQAERYPDASLGLLSHLEDATIRGFYGYRHSGCSDPARCVSGNAFAEALREVRDRASRWSTYFAEGHEHTFLVSERFYRTPAGGPSPAAWTQALIDGNASDVSSARD